MKINIYPIVAYKSSKWFAVLFKIEQTADRSRDGLLKAGVDRTIGKIPCHFCQAEGKS